MIGSYQTISFEFFWVGVWNLFFLGPDPNPNPKKPCSKPKSKPKTHFSLG